MVRRQEERGASSGRIPSCSSPYHQLGISSSSTDDGSSSGTRGAGIVIPLAPRHFKLIDWSSRSHPGESSYILACPRRRRLIIQTRSAFEVSLCLEIFHRRVVYLVSNRWQKKTKKRKENVLRVYTVQHTLHFPRDLNLLISASSAASSSGLVIITGNHLHTDTRLDHDRSLLL